MSYLPNILSITSDVGVNSDTVTSGGNWVGNIYTGSGELNDYAYVGVNLQVDEAGTLYFDFSQDGSNWSTYPVAGFTIASGINEVHTAWKGGRYMRPRFEGVDGSRTFFRLQTYYSNLPLPLSAPLNQSIGDDQDATVVRAVNTGQIPDGTFINNPADGAGFRTTAVVSDGGTFDSGVLNLTDYTQVGTSIVCDKNGTLEFIFGSSASMTGSTPGANGVERVITVPYSASSGYQYYSAPAFTPYVRYRFTNTAGQGDTTQLFFDTRFLTKSVSGQLLRVDGFISPAMVANLGRNIQVGEDPTGVFTNIKTDGAAFITTDNLTSGATYDSGVLDANNYNQVQTQIACDNDGTIEFIFGSSETMTGNTVGVNGVERVLTVPYVAADGFQLYSAPAFTPYVRYTFTNDGVDTTTQFFFETKLLTKSLSGQVLGVNSFISPNMVANLGRNIIVGQTDGGNFLNVPVDEKGHLEVSLHGPLNPFGSVHTEKLTPVFQTDAVYGINSGQIIENSSLSGITSAVDSKFSVSTGTTNGAQASIQSRRRLRYRPGQGVIGRFTAKYTSPVANSYQIAGYGHAEDGVYFGYKDIAGSTPEFGILYVNRGVREIQTLNITTGSSTAENVTVTLDGTAFNVPVTNSGNIQRTVWEISQFDYTGWSAYPDGDNVVFVSSSAGNKTGSFTLAGTTAAGTFSETKAGANATEEFIPQSSWNGDKLDGTGNSGVTLDPTKGNVYQINIQYLGFGAIEFKVEVVAGGNNPIWVTVHTLEQPNNLTTTSFSNPSFPFTLAAYSAGSTTDLTVESGSFAGFVEGRIETRGNRFVYTNSLQAGVTTGAYHALGTIKNKLVYNGKASQVVINIKQFAAHIEDNASGGTMYLIRNGELQGNPDFQDYSTTSSTSWDTAATTVTFSDNNQVVAAMPLGINGAEDLQLDDTITIQPGEWLTLAARSDTTTLDYCTISVTTREDQ